MKQPRKAPEGDRGKPDWVDSVEHPRVARDDVGLFLCRARLCSSLKLFVVRRIELLSFLVDGRLKRSAAGPIDEDVTGLGENRRERPSALDLDWGRVGDRFVDKG